MAGLGFADAEDDRHQYTIVIHNVMARLWEAEALADGEFATGPQRSGDLANDQSEQLDHAIQNKGQCSESPEINQNPGFWERQGRLNRHRVRRSFAKRQIGHGTIRAEIGPSQ